MPSFVNFWNRIVEWFQDRQDRTHLIRNFNRSARESFVNGYVPIILEAKVSRGNSNYRHQFSDFLSSGFRIKAMAGHQLTKQQTINIGNVILSNDMLIRRLVVLGFDTLEVCSDVGEFGCQWQLRDYIMIGQGNSN